MNRAARTNSGTMLVVVLALATGCAKKTEDVRIKLCRNVTERLLESMKPIEWKSQDAGVRREGDAAIRLAFTISRADYENRVVTSACFFKHDLVEESAVDHVDPLAAFATLPYAMTIEGEHVPEELLRKAVKDEQVEPFVEFFDKVQKDIESLRK
jgi:hypothetical protein